MRSQLGGKAKQAPAHRKSPATKRTNPIVGPRRHSFSFLWVRRAIGNQGVSLRGAGRIQASPILGEPGNEHEREAAWVSDRVIDMADPPNGLKEGVRLTPLGPPRSVEAATNAMTSHPTVGEVEAAARVVSSGGRPLPNQTRGFFERRFGRDFSRVRVHDDRSAGEAARTIDARAYTLGTHIAFAPGEYEPNTVRGRRLIAHELTHVGQQTDPSGWGDGHGFNTQAGLTIQRWDPPHETGRHQEGLHLDEWSARLRGEGWEVYRPPRSRWPPYLRRAFQGSSSPDMVVVHHANREIRVCDVTRYPWSPGSFEDRPMAHIDATRLRSERLVESLHAQDRAGRLGGSSRAPDVAGYRINWQERYWGQGGRESTVFESGTPRTPRLLGEPNITEEEQWRRARRRGEDVGWATEPGERRRRRRRRTGRGRGRASRAVRGASRTGLATLLVILLGNEVRESAQALADDIRRRGRRASRLRGSQEIHGLTINNLGRRLQQVFGGDPLTNRTAAVRAPSFNAFWSALGDFERTLAADEVDFWRRYDGATRISDPDRRVDQMVSLHEELDGTGLGTWRSSIRGRTLAELLGRGLVQVGTPGKKQYVEDALEIVSGLLPESVESRYSRQANSWRAASENRHEFGELLVQHYVSVNDASLVSRQATEFAAGYAMYVRTLERLRQILLGYRSVIDHRIVNVRDELERAERD